MIDYALVPPEVNSGRLYSGPGSAPMMAAASAWRGLAGEITSTLTSYETTLSQLVDDEWMGPASAAMTAAAKPYLAWMADTATKAEQAATQASSAAAAFETAHANTPPPAMIAANRAQHKQLVATNVVGQNTSAIMASEAHYQQMWAQAAGVMYGYASSSAAATQLSPFAEPAQTTNPAGQGNQAAATQQAAASGTGQIAQMMPAVQSSLQSLSAPGVTAQPADAGSALGGLINNFLTNASVNGIASLITDPLNGIVSFGGTTLAYTPSTLIPLMTSFFGGGGFNAFGGGAVGSGLGALLAPGGPLSALGELGGGAAAASAASAFTMSAATPVVSAGVGQATLVGSSLSAPAAWAASATPATTTVAATTEALQASSWEAAPEIESMAAMPGGMPMGGDRGGFGLSTPRYGFKPTVMPRPVIAG
ncbi:PPE family protein [Mycobacterium sp. M1]|uniref:PPE family protein n=1 Tax=Mycolicibacter acidiphilus TaxID=2835306 RepID=A0ABS5RQ70_9MYCO|nr:PPE family protein [Mycolicibacter acidiphilus]MBS9535671.1 PPE family protein [Mycolicibacter acidiphilus]